MLSVAYCDDEYAALSLYSEQIQAMFDARNCPASLDMYQDIDLLIQAIGTGKKYDILFLDIDMPGINGIDGGKKLRELAPDALIVFVSFHEQYVFDTFQVRPFRFIRKAKFHQDLEEAAPALVQAFLQQNEEIVIHSGTLTHILFPKQVLYIESCGKMLEIVTKRETVRLRYKMMDMEQLLDPYGFIRVHKGFLINVHYIKQVGSDEIILQNDLPIPLSKHRKHDVLLKLECLL